MARARAGPGALTPPGRVYRAAIVGCGRKAATLDDEERCRINYSVPPDTHAGAYRSVPEVELVAAGDPNESKLQVMRERWNVPAVYRDYRDMLAREAIDVLSVTTRAPLHARVTLDAVAAGVKGILCEKPIAVSLQEADEMVAACERAGVVVSVNHTRRWHPAYEAAEALVQSGRIGRVMCIIGTCPPPLIHNGTHLFDAMRLFGGDVAEVCGRLADGPMDDRPGKAMLWFRSGALGLADLEGGGGFSVEVQGTTGRLFIDQAREGFTLWEYRAGARAENRRWYQGGPCPERLETHITPEIRGGTLAAAIEELLACLPERSQTRSDGRAGRAALEIAFAVYHSDREGGHPVSLPLAARDLLIEAR